MSADIHRKEGGELMKPEYIVVYIIFTLLMSLVFEVIDRVIKAISKKVKAKRLTEAEQCNV